VASYAVVLRLPVDAVCRSLSVSMVDAAPNGGITVPRRVLPDLRFRGAKCHASGLICTDLDQAPCVLLGDHER